MAQSLEVRLPEIEPYIHNIKESIMKIKDLLDEDEWYGSIKPQAENLIAAIVTAYINTHLHPYNKLE